METLDLLWKRGRDLLGTRLSILGGAMSWVSDQALVSAISNAGAFGVLACGAMSPALLEEEIRATQERTSLPFGVNIVTLHPQFYELLEVCEGRKVTHVVLGGGLPPTDAIARLKAQGIRVLCFAPVLSVGKRLARAGADALILEGSEAGGHIGPVSTGVLAQEILPTLGRELPIFIAGGIGRGEAIVHYLQMGASGCQLGTRFVCAHESRAHPNFKQTFIRSQARDAVASIQLDPRFPVIPVRAIENAASQKFLELQRQVLAEYNEGKVDQKEAQMRIEYFWAGALKKAVIEGDVENGSLMAGQSVGMVTAEQSVAEILDELVSQALHALRTLHAA